MNKFSIFSIALAGIFNLVQWIPIIFDLSFTLVFSIFGILTFLIIFLAILIKISSITSTHSSTQEVKPPPVPTRVPTIVILLFCSVPISLIWDALHGIITNTINVPMFFGHPFLWDLPHLITNLNNEPFLFYSSILIYLLMGVGIGSLLIIEIWKKY